MRHRIGRVLVAGLLGALAVTDPAAAAPWGGITPGKTTRREVESLYGRPTRERVVTEEGRTAAEWTYAGDRAPRGIERMVVSFGFLVAGRFVPDVVRGVTLYPKPRVFSVQAVANGWGKPDAFGTEEQTGRPAMRYEKSGLLVVLDASGQWAEVLLFAPEKAASVR